MTSLCRISSAVAIALITMSACSVVDAQVEFPEKLIATPAKIAELKELIKRPGSHHQLAHSSMKARVEQPDLKVSYPSGIGKYENSYRAREAALLSLLADSRIEQNKFADIALGAITTGSEVMKSSKGLEPASVGLNIALAYNWLADTWSAEDSAKVRRIIVDGIDDWPRFKHVNVSGSMASNWAGVTRGAELVMIHAAGMQGERQDRLNSVVGDILAHIRNGYGSQGASQEGMGYTEYPGQFIGAAAVVAAQAGDPRILDAMRKKGWWRLAMFTHPFQQRTFGPGDVKFLLWGVASRGMDEGWASLLIPTAPPEMLPYFLWWYDRNLGKLFEGPIDGFDRHRAGTTWSLLLYPGHVEPADPTGVFPSAIADDHGFYIFRNRWQNSDDIQVLAASDRVHHDHAWDQPDAFSLGIIGFNTLFAGSAGKETKDQNLYSTLLVDGKYQVGRNLTGETVSFDNDASGGYLIADGGSQYAKLGLDDAKRHTLVRFSDPNTNTAVISTLDRIKSREDHTYTWQLDPGPPAGGGVGVRVETSTFAGRPSFLMRGDANGYVQGWVLHPADAKVIAGDPLRVETSGGDADIWIVMFVGSGAMPNAQISGQGLETTLSVNRLHLRFDRVVGGIVAEHIQ